jgi:hypothetical protein
MKSYFLFIILSISQTISSQNFVLEKTWDSTVKYYKADYADSAVYFLTNQGLIVLKYINENEHQLVFKYNLDLDSSSLLSVNEDKLAILSNDTIYIFSLADEFEPTLIQKYYYSEALEKIIPFGQYFIFIKKNNLPAEMVDVSAQVQIKYTFDFPITSSIGFAYPYMVKKVGAALEFYKYTVSDPFYFMRSIIEPGLSDLYTHKNYITYSVYDKPAIGPPTSYFVATRSVASFDFPIVWRAHLYQHSVNFGFLYFRKASYQYFTAVVNNQLNNYRLFVRNGAYEGSFNTNMDKHILTNHSAYFYNDSLFSKNVLIPIFYKFYFSNHPYLINTFNNEIILQKSTPENNLVEVYKTEFKEDIYKIYDDIIVTKDSNNYKFYKVENDSIALNLDYHSNEELSFIKYYDPYLVTNAQNKLRIYERKNNTFVHLFVDSFYPSDVVLKDLTFYALDPQNSINRYVISDSLILNSWKILEPDYHSINIRDKYLIGQKDDKILLIDVKTNPQGPLFLDTISLSNFKGIENHPSGFYVKHGQNPSILDKYIIEDSKFKHVYQENLTSDNPYQLLESNGKLILNTKQTLYWYKDTTTIVTQINESNFTPNGLKLSQNYPNPFNPSTKIKYSIPQSSKVTLKVFDVLGKEVAELVNEEKDAGEYEVDFSVGSFGDGSKISSGVYFYQLKAGSLIQTNKMILTK